MKINPIGSYCLHPAKNEMPPHSQGNSRGTTTNYDTITIQKEGEDVCFRKSLVSHIWTDVRRGASADKLAENAIIIFSISMTPPSSPRLCLSSHR